MSHRILTAAVFILLASVAGNTFAQSLLVEGTISPQEIFSSPNLRKLTEGRNNVRTAMADVKRQLSDALDRYAQSGSQNDLNEFIRLRNWQSQLKSLFGQLDAAVKPIRVRLVDGPGPPELVQKFGEPLAETVRRNADRIGRQPVLVLYTREQAPTTFITTTRVPQPAKSIPVNLNPTGTNSATAPVNISGTWRSAKPGTAVYRVVVRGNTITWTATGSYGGKPYSHEASGTITGRSFHVNFRDTGGAFVGNVGTVDGTVSADGQSITIQSGLNATERRWVRDSSSASPRRSSSVSPNMTGLLGGDA